MNRQGARLTECWGQIPPARDCWSRKLAKQFSLFGQLPPARGQRLFSRPVGLAGLPSGTPGLPRRRILQSVWCLAERRQQRSITGDNAHGLCYTMAFSPGRPVKRPVGAVAGPPGRAPAGHFETGQDGVPEPARAKASLPRWRPSPGVAPGRATCGRSLLRIAVFQLPRRGWGPRLTAEFRLGKPSLQSKPQSSNAQRHRENKRRRRSV